MNAFSAVTVALCLNLSAGALAQDDELNISKATLEYNKYRSELTLPLHHVAKIRSLMAGIKVPYEDDRALSPKVYNRLTVSERFTYVALHAEVFSQNCDAMLPVPESEKRLFSHFPSPFEDEYSWSQRQLDFMKNNRTEVIKLLRETISARGRCGVNLKAMAWEVNAKELITDLAALYKKDRKDKDLLTLMMLLMNDAKYWPFLDSRLWFDLYGNDMYWGNSVMSSPEAENTVLRHALAFSKEKQ